MTIFDVLTMFAMLFAIFGALLGLIWLGMRSSGEE